LFCSIKTTDEQLPIAAQFIHYLHHKQFGSELPLTGWWDQVGEDLTDEKFDDTDEKLTEILESPARGHIRRALDVTAAMMAGNDGPMRDLIAEKEHIWIIGVPRSGGTYLLKECMRAVGKDYTTTWGQLCHDGFPPVTSYRENPEPARSMRFIYAMAQYFVMASLEDGDVIPKKLHTLIAEPGFVNKYLTNVYITRRHPMDSCMSMLGRGGGMPEDRRMPRDRTNIERQVWDLLAYHGVDPDNTRNTDYFYTYLEYWNLFTKELDKLNGTRVNYNELPTIAEGMHERYESGLEPETFVNTEYDRTVLHGGGATSSDQQERGVELQSVGLGARAECQHVPAGQ